MTDINRYAYTDFTQNPYIYYHGIPFQKNNFIVNNNNQDRTIIRTLDNGTTPQYIVPVPANNQFVSQSPITQQYKLPVQKNQQLVAPINNKNVTLQTNAPIPFNSSTPYNQTNNAGNFALDTFGDLWSKFVRKDKIFERYSCDCDN